MNEEVSQKDMERRKQLDDASRRNMKKCAEFVARMVEKYGREVLAEIQDKEKVEP